MGFERLRGNNTSALRLRRFAAALVLAAGAAALAPVRPVRAAADTIPARLSDQDFWKLSDSLSEPNGFFRSDNILSNEIWFQYVLKDLVAQTKPGGVYVGVGPEQNFTYIAALKPKIVFITDVRRGNLEMHLMYKALFELSKDRADFVSMLFTKKRPAGLTTESSALDIFDKYWDINNVTLPETAFKANLQAIDDLLTKKHGFPLSKDDLDGVEYCYRAFYWYGPSVTYNSTASTTGGGRGGGSMANYYDLMTATDGAVDRSYLGNEENFRILKDLEERNLIVPVVGNFGGPKALRAVGQWVRDHGATITAMYLSNVEQYLTQDGIWGNFCSNVASMPLDEHSTFIRSQQGGGGGGSGLMSYLGSMQADTRGCGVPSQTPPPRVRIQR